MLTSLDTPASAFREKKVEGENLPLTKWTWLAEVAIA